MKLILSSAWLFFVTVFQITYSQSPSFDRAAFFNDTSVLNATLVTDMSKILNNHKKNSNDYHANFITTLPDGTKVNDQILLELRGHMRLDFCFFPPMKLIFNYKKTSVLYSLKSLKLVSECKDSKEFEQYLLKEFIVYKIYNLLTDMSFRVRLLTLTLQDSTGKKKTVTLHAFLVEDIKDVAKRNNCTVGKYANLQTESTDRRQMTLMAIFEYMIGNTDWAVSANHNTRLIVSEKDPTAKPYSVPYDFDYSGFVNTFYAVVDERLDIENVRQRLYRGYPRTMPELEEALNVYRLQKDKIYSLINNFNLLTSRTKNEIIDYMDEFYKIINDAKMVKVTFIENARTE